MADQVIIVTGAGNGIGLSIVQQLILSDAASLVIAVDVDGSKLEELQQKYTQRLDVVIGDVSQRSTSEEAVSHAMMREGRINTIILNAGILKPTGSVAGSDVDEWKRLFDINFFALLHTIQIALPHLRASKGKILMTSSGVSLKPCRGWIPYACAKTAMNYLASSLTLEEPDVSVLCITPGIVDTGIQSEVRREHRDGLPKDVFDWLNDLHATGGLLQPEQPAKAFVRLALGVVSHDLVGQVIAWNDSRLNDMA